MKFIKRLLLFCLIFLFGLFIYNNYSLNNATDSINNVFNRLLAKANNSNLFDINGLGDLVSDDDLKSLKDSGISGKDVSINATYYPYYNMLSNSEKNIYRQIYANVNSMKNTFVPVNDIDANGLKKTVEAVFYDHQELFWLNNKYSYKYTSNGKCVQIIMSFNDTSKDIANSKKKFNDAVNEVINGASKYNTNYEKEKYVHDYIINNTNYDTGASLNQSAYSVLVNKASVCAGYARAFQYIMIKLGIPTYYVVGSANEEHAWNIVALDDGYYNVDVTWDDQAKISYAYFNKTDKEFSSTHNRRELSLSLPSCNATKYRYNSSANNSEYTIKKIIRKYIITNNDNKKEDNNNLNNNDYKDDKVYGNPNTSNNDINDFEFGDSNEDVEINTTNENDINNNEYIIENSD